MASIDYATAGAQGQVKAKLNLGCKTDGKAAQQLDLTLSFYQNGILRVLLEEPNGNRFRISQESLQPVVEEQLRPVPITDENIWIKESGNFFQVAGLFSESGDEHF